MSQRRHRSYRRAVRQVLNEGAGYPYVDALPRPPGARLRHVVRAVRAAGRPVALVPAWGPGPDRAVDETGTEIGLVPHTPLVLRVVTS